jgi:hypothetical protein
LDLSDNIWKILVHNSGGRQCWKFIVLVVTSDSLAPPAKIKHPARGMQTKYPVFERETLLNPIDASLTRRQVERADAFIDKSLVL